MQTETISAAVFTHHLVNTQIIHIHIKALISTAGSFRTTVAQCNDFKSVSLPFSEFRKAQKGSETMTCALLFPTWEPGQFLQQPECLAITFTIYITMNSDRSQKGSS